MIESTREMVDGAQAPGLSLPLTALESGARRLSRPDFAAEAAQTSRSAAASAGIAPHAPDALHARALPGLDAWSLACRRKTLRGVWRGWLLKSHKSVR